MADGSMTQVLLCMSMTAMVRVRSRLGSCFFSEFIELEFYFFRKYDPKPEFSRTFDTFFNLLFNKELALKKPENVVERYHREIRVPNHCGPMVLRVKLEIL